MVKEKLITPAEALMRIEPDQLNQLLRPVFDPKEKATALKAGRFLAKGLNAGPGAATGKVVFSAPKAEEWKAKGEKVILVRGRDLTRGYQGDGRVGGDPDGPRRD